MDLVYEKNVFWPILRNRCLCIPLCADTTFSSPILLKGKEGKVVSVHVHPKAGLRNRCLCITLCADTTFSMLRNRPSPPHPNTNIVAMGIQIPKQLFGCPPLHPNCIPKATRSNILDYEQISFLHGLAPRGYAILTKQ